MLRCDQEPVCAILVFLLGVSTILPRRRVVMPINDAQHALRPQSLHAKGRLEREAPFGALEA